MHTLLSHRYLHYIVLFLLAIITVNSHYHFGDINHIEQLPHIFAHQDESYLVNDFFVTYAREINPRYYYAKVIAYLSGFMQLEHLFYLTTLIANYCIFLITFYCVKELGAKLHQSEPRQHLIAYFSVALLPLFTFGQLGGAGLIIEQTLVPQLVAMPLILVAYWQSTKGNFPLVLVCCLVAVFMQPSLVLLTLLPICANLLLQNISLPQLFKTSILALLITLATYILFIRYSHSFVLPDQDFIQILAHFRHPHHYIPSQFPLKDYTITFLMLGTLSASLVYFSRYNKKVVLAKYFVTTTLLSLVLLSAGYLFVEVFPLRIVVSLQTFRITFLLRWLFVVVAPMAAAIFFSQRFENKRGHMLITGIACIFIVTTLLRGHNTIVSPRITMATPHQTRLYEYLTQKTPEDAVFLTPHNFGDMRIIPRRAIVVDTKAFPFNDSYMQEWYERVKNSYGDGDFVGNYKAMTDEKLYWLKDLYRFDYAILFTETATAHTVIYEDYNYKVVRM